MSKKRKKSYDIDEQTLDITIENCQSVTDCTGLIPFSPRGKYDLENYSQIKNILPEDIDKNN